MAWIQVIDEEVATGSLKELYDESKEKRGKLSNIMRIQSLNPEAMKKHMDLYLTLLFKKTSLSREDRELLAVVVSKENNCKYCMNHHGEALSYLWKDKEKVKEFIHRPETVTFSEKQKTMVNYASRLTKSPSLVTEEDIIQMRSAGFSDKEILDINLIICYFNFVNRIALGLGVSFSAEEMKGYKY